MCPIWLARRHAVCACLYQPADGRITWSKLSAVPTTLEPEEQLCSGASPPPLHCPPAPPHAAVPAPALAASPAAPAALAFQWQYQNSPHALSLSHCLQKLPVKVVLQPHTTSPLSSGVKMMLSRTWEGGRREVGARARMGARVRVTVGVGWGWG